MCGLVGAVAGVEPQRAPSPGRPDRSKRASSAQVTAKPKTPRRAASCSIASSTPAPRCAGQGSQLGAVAQGLVDAMRIAAVCGAGSACSIRSVPWACGTASRCRVAANRLACECTHALGMPGGTGGVRDRRSGRRGGAGTAGARRPGRRCRAPRRPPAPGSPRSARRAARRAPASASTPAARSRRMYSAAVSAGRLPLSRAGIAPSRVQRQEAEHHVGRRRSRRPRPGRAGRRRARAATRPGPGPARRAGPGSAAARPGGRRPPCRRSAPGRPGRRRAPAAGSTLPAPRSGSAASGHGPGTVRGSPHDQLRGGRGRGSGTISPLRPGRGSGRCSAGRAAAPAAPAHLAGRPEQSASPVRSTRPPAAALGGLAVGDQQLGLGPGVGEQVPPVGARHSTGPVRPQRAAICPAPRSGTDWKNSSGATRCPAADVPGGGLVRGHVAPGAGQHERGHARPGPGRAAGRSGPAGSARRPRPPAG